MEKYDVESTVSDRAGALLSLGLVEMGEAVMPLFCPLDKEADVVFTVFQGRFGRLLHPSDSEEGSKEPDPDFPSKPVSARFWSSGCIVSSMTLCKDKIKYRELDPSTHHRVHFSGCCRPRCWYSSLTFQPRNPCPYLHEALVIGHCSYSIRTCS